MWVQPKDPTRVDAKDRANYFDPPFGIVETIPRLEKFQTNVSIGETKLLDDSWAKPHVDTMMNDYMSEILAWLTESKWKKRSFSASEQKKWNAAMQAFEFDPASCTSEEDADGYAGVMNREYTAALKFYVQMIVSEEIKARLMSHISAHTPDELDVMPWNDVLAVITSQIRSSSVLDLYTDWLCNARKPGETILDWTDRAKLHYTQFPEDEGPSEKTAMQHVFAYISTRERSILNISDTFGEWRGSVVDNKEELALINKFKCASVQHFVLNLPVRKDFVKPEEKRTNFKARRRPSQVDPNKPGDSGTGNAQPNQTKTKICKFFARGTCTNGQNCNFLHERVAARRNSQPSQTQARPSVKPNQNRNDTKKKRACFTCGATDHIQKDCPRKAQVKAFLTRVDSAEKHICLATVVDFGDSNLSDSDSSLLELVDYDDSRSSDDSGSSDPDPTLPTLFESEDSCSSGCDPSDASPLSLLDEVNFSSDSESEDLLDGLFGFPSRQKWQATVRQHSENPPISGEREVPGSLHLSASTTITRCELDLLSEQCVSGTLHDSSAVDGVGDDNKSPPRASTTSTNADMPHTLLGYESVQGTRAQHSCHAVDDWTSSHVQGTAGASFGGALHRLGGSTQLMKCTMCSKKSFQDMIYRCACGQMHHFFCASLCQRGFDKLQRDSRLPDENTDVVPVDDSVEVRRFDTNWSDSNAVVTKESLVTPNVPVCESFPVTTGTGSILKVKARVQTARGVLTCVLALDTCCNTNIFSPGWAQSVSASFDRPGSAGTFGGQRVQLGGPAELQVLLDNGSAVLLTGVHATDSKHLPRGVAALISSDGCKQLDVDLNWHMFNTPKLQPGEIPFLRQRSSLPSYTNDAQVFLTEVKMREYLERKGDSLFDGKRSTIDDVRYGGTLTDEQVAILKAITKKYEHVFGNGVDLPPPMNGPPHELILKPNSRPIHMPRPKYTPAKEEYLTKWARQALASGLWEFGGEAENAFLIHLAGKEGPPGFEKEQLK